MQANKHDLLEIIQTLEFVSKSPPDFGYALSAGATLLIHDLVSQINKNITATIDEVSNSVLEDLKQKFQNILTNSRYKEEEADLEFRLRRSLAPILGSLGQNETSTSARSALDQIVTRVRELSSDEQADYEKSVQLLQNQANYLQFFETSSGSQLEIDFQRWGSPLMQVGAEISRFLAGNFTRDLHAALLQQLTTYSNAVTQNYLNNNLGNDDISERLQRIQADIGNLQSLRSNLLMSCSAEDGGQFDLVVFVDDFLAGFRFGGGDLRDERQMAAWTKTLEVVYDFLRAQVLISKAGAAGPVDSLRWFLILDGAIATLQKEKEWLQFLVDLLNELSEPNIQIHDEFGFKGLDETAIRNNPEQFWSNFSKLDRIVRRYRESIAPLLLTESQNADSLSALLRIALKNGQTCDWSDNRTLTVKGTFVVLSEALQCYRAKGAVAKTLTLMAAHTVFLDADIDGAQLNPKLPEHNVQVVIIAPIWKVPGGNFTLNLSGKQGRKPDPWNYRAQYTGQSGAAGEQIGRAHV